MESILSKLMSITSGFDIKSASPSLLTVPAKPLKLEYLWLRLNSSSESVDKTLLSLLSTPLLISVSLTEGDEAAGLKVTITSISSPLSTASITSLSTDTAPVWLQEA